jgi:asparagine synthase (glutamine-hydrolysing)
MCGLVALFDILGRRPIDAALLERMTDALAHRGPDGAGLHVEPGLGLGHRRLAIIDRAGGRQPLANETGDVHVVFNGEIYGHAALAEELRAAGHVFATRSDTETIVHAWEEWGERCVERLDGMFAFAIWDRRRDMLFAARDRLGKKPLHYAWLPDGGIALASEIKALLLHPGIGRRIDVRAIEEFFAYGYVPDPRTIYAGIHKLPPGSMLSIARGGGGPLTPRRHWRPAFAADPRTTADEAAERLAAELKGAVGRRLVAEVPLGAFLSGGLDSSAVVATMAALDTRPVETFAIGFRQAAYDESRHAAAVAARFGTTHRARIVDADAFDLIDRLAAVYDEPFGDASALPTMQLCAAARAHVSVALTGDGGDEVFAGYRRHRWHARISALRGLLPAAPRRALFGALAAIYPKADWAPRALRARNTLRELSLEPLEAYFLSLAVAPDPVRAAIFSHRLKRELDGHHALGVLARHADEAPTGDPLAWAQYLDLTTWLPGGILTKLDRASMAVGLEARCPLLDHRLVEWAGTLPASLKLRAGSGKWILKRAMDGRLPPAILARPKQGFVLPIARWFRGELHGRLRAALLGGALADSRFFDLSAIGRLIDRHRSGAADNARVLWLLLAFEGFLRHDAGARLTETLPAGAGDG